MAALVAYEVETAAGASVVSSFDDGFGTNMHVLKAVLMNGGIYSYWTILDEDCEGDVHVVGAAYETILPVVARRALMILFKIAWKSSHCKIEDIKDGEDLLMLLGDIMAALDDRLATIEDIMI